MSLTGDDLVETFRGEALERIDAIVDDLLAIEKGAASPETVDSLFRHVHTIKGSAGMIGFDDTYSLAHAFEDVLGEARELGSLSSSVVEPLLRAADALRESVAGGGDASATLAELRDIRLEGEAASAPVAADERQDPAADLEADADQRPVAELRSLRVGAQKVDRLLDLTGETVLHHRRLEHLLEAGRSEEGDEQTEDELRRGTLLLDELQDTVLGLRALPLSSITRAFSRTVRDLAVSVGKEAELDVAGDETHVDRAVLEIIYDALAHLVRNAVAHGIEAPAEREAAGKPRCGRIEVRAEQRGDRVLVRVADDGAGVSTELLRAAAGGSLADVLAEAGVSSAEAVTEVSGRGVGLDAVKRGVESVGGALELSSEPGRGTTAVLSLPVSVALVEALLVERGDVVVGLPLTQVSEVVAGEGALWLGGRRWIEVRGEQLPLGDLVAVLGGSAPEAPERALALIVAAGQKRAAVICDRALGKEELVLKSLGPLLDAIPAYLGGAMLGDGRVALLVDPAYLVRRASADRPAAHAAASDGPPVVLVVDDQFVVRELQRSILESAGYRVLTAPDGRNALEHLASEPEVDIVVSDIQMPEMDGFELLARIRSHPSRASTPVVIVSSQGSAEDERRGLEAGADAYIGKDRFDQAALLETVDRLIGG